MGVVLTIEVECESTAAECSSKKLGRGKMTHLELGAYAIKEMVRRKIISVIHIDGITNTADLHTKHVDVKTLEKFLPEIGRRARVEGDVGRMCKQVRVNKIEQITRAPPLRHEDFDVGKLGDMLEWGIELERADRGIPTDLRRAFVEQRADEGDEFNQIRFECFC